MFSETYKIETFIPKEYIDKLRHSLNEINALCIGGNYDYCMFVSRGIGSFRPLNGSKPYEGKIGEVCKTEEFKVEFCCKRDVVKKAVGIIKEVHPYEVPVINIIPILSTYDF